MPTNLENLIGLAILAASPFAFYFYFQMLRKVRSDGGKVAIGWVTYLDLAPTLTIGGALAGLAIMGFANAKEKANPMTADQVLPGMLLLLILAGGVLIFLQAKVGTPRRIADSQDILPRPQKSSLVEIFGFRNLPAGGAAARGLGMLLAALPLVLICGVITILILQEQAEEQELVRLFTQVVRKGDFNTIANIFLAGVLVAPICEEILFRGYFYPVAKRFIGAVPGALITATLFAATHVNLASFAGLLVLALCFILAYERTGSLLVPICMHAFFNGINLMVLYLRAQFGG